MINHEIGRLIEDKQRHGKFIHPDYDKYCFSNIPSTILSFFGIKSNKPVLPKELHLDSINIDSSSKVVLFLIDGFGLNQWEMYNSHNNFFRRFTKRGLVSPLTTVFPSTTAATITTINSGLTPQEHGLLEWNLYFKEIDMILESLPFTPLNEKHLLESMKRNVDPKILFDKNTIYQKLKNKGVKSFKFLDKNYAHSEYSKLTAKGSETIPFIKTSDLIVNLRKKLEEEKGPAYFYVYYSGIDSIEHNYGPHTEQHTADISLLSYSLEKLLLDKISKQSARETVFLMTSDHGQLNIPPKKTIYLNKYKKVVNGFQKSKQGKTVLPWGSPRDVFLNIKPEKIEEIEKFLSDKLRRKAQVMKTNDAFEMGLFGRGNVHKKFFDRIGNLLILPYGDSLVWYEHVKGKRRTMIGHHGGLSKDEMLIPFGISKLSDLM